MSFVAPISRDAMSPDDVLRAADSLETPFGAYLKSSAEEGFLSSGVGMALHAAPPLVPVEPGKTTGLDYSTGKLAQTIDEPTFKQSLNYRTGIPWQPGMTEARAAALAADFDAANYRQNLYSKYQGGALGKAAGIGAMFLGGAASPENYIPFIGPEVRAAMVARLGVVGGHALVGATEGLVGTALTEPFIWSFQRDRGQDYGLPEITADLLLGTAAGGAFGGLHGVYSKLRGREAFAPAETPGEPPRPIQEHVTVPPEPGVEARVAEPPAEPAPVEVVPELTRPPRPAGDMLTPEVLGREVDALNAAHDALARDEPVDVGAMVPEPAPGSYIDVFHGTPHTFEQFDPAHIGTGEGVQAYGHGFYYAESRSVGENYKGAGVTGSFIFDGRPSGAVPLEDLQRMSPAESAAFNALKNSSGDIAEALNNLRLDSDINPLLREAASTLEKWVSDNRVKSVISGNLYGVRLHVRPDELLDWDKPLSEQPAKVREAFQRAFDDAANRSPAGPGERAAFAQNEEEKLGVGLAYRSLEMMTGSPEAASAVLRDAGIPGIRYLDAGSRSNWTVREHNGEFQPENLSTGSTGPTYSSREEAENYVSRQQATDTRNIVLFDPSRAEITHVNDRAVARSIPPPPSVVEAAPRVGKAEDELATFAKDAGLEGFEAPTLEEQAKTAEQAAKAKETGKPAPEQEPTPLDGELQALRDAGRLTPEDERALSEAERDAKEAEGYAAAYEMLPTCFRFI